MPPQMSYEVSAIVLSVIFFIIWLVRLEAKLLYLEKEFAVSLTMDQQREKAIWNKFDTMQETLNQILQKLSRLEGKLEGHG